MSLRPATSLAINRSGKSGPSIPADPFFSSVSLLLHSEGTNGQTTNPDSSSFARTITRNGLAVLSSAQKPFGNTSAFFPGAQGHWWSAADAVALQMGTAQFTVEGLFFIAQGNGSPYSFMTKGVNTAGGLLIGCSGTNIVVRCNGITDTTFGPFTNIQNIWTHVAVVRDASDVIRAYVGGVQVGSATIVFNNNDAATFNVGHDINTAFTMDGYIKEFRVTKGVCRYPGGTSFTPPSAPFPDA